MRIVVMAMAIILAMTVVATVAAARITNTNSESSSERYMVYESPFDRWEFNCASGSFLKYLHDPKYDIGEEFTVCMWFRRDVFNKQQFLISKGHWGDRVGWRFMIKQTKPPYQYEQIQLDVGDGCNLNYYKTLKGITNSDWHCIVFIFNANKIYTDSKGVATHGMLILDGAAEEYYMARSDGAPLIRDVKPLNEPMYIGRHSDKKNAYCFTGVMSNITMYHVDIGMDAAINYYRETKHLYE